MSRLAQLELQSAMSRAVFPRRPALVPASAVLHSASVYWLRHCDEKGAFSWPVYASDGGGSVVLCVGGSEAHAKAVVAGIKEAIRER